MSLGEERVFRVRNESFSSFSFGLSSEEGVKIEYNLKYLGNLPPFFKSWNSQKSVKYLLSGKLEGLRISGAEVFDTFFAVFQANLLNKNEILAIVGAKYVEKFTILDQKRSFYVILSTLTIDRYWLFRFVRNV